MCFFWRKIKVTVSETSIPPITPTATIISIFIVLRHFLNKLGWYKLKKKISQNYVRYRCCTSKLCVMIGPLCLSLLFRLKFSLKFMSLLLLRLVLIVLCESCCFPKVCFLYLTFKTLNRMLIWHIGILMVTSLNLSQFMRKKIYIIHLTIFTKYNKGKLFYIDLFLFLTWATKPKFKKPFLWT